MESDIAILDLSRPAQINIKNAAAQFSSATTRCGFIYVRFPENVQGVIDRIQSVQRQFFNQTLAQKNSVAIDLNNRGYLGTGKALMSGSKRHDQKEVFFWGREVADNDPDILASVPLCGPNQWPDNLPDFRQSILDYSAMIRDIGDLLLRIIASSINAPEDFFQAHYERPMLRGQLLRYPTTDGDAEQFGVAPHSDFGCITLLLQETAGLEVQFPDGQWVPAPPLANTLIVNIGDLLERWSNNRLPSTKHRVRNRSSHDRYSIAMFYDPSPTAVVDPLELLPDDASEYPAVGAAAYILSRNSHVFSHYKS